VAAVEEASETAALVTEAGCGVVVPPGDPDALAAAIRDAHDGRIDLEELGRRGREWVVRNADRAVAVTRYRELLREVRCS
jgi:glycosyltransferase involved in cell wall biosynthesis